MTVYKIFQTDRHLTRDWLCCFCLFPTKHFSPPSTQYISELILLFSFLFRFVPETLPFLCASPASVVDGPPVTLQPSCSDFNPEILSCCKLVEVDSLLSSCSHAAVSQFVMCRQIN